MNVTRENLGELDLLLKIEIAENDYADDVTKKLKSYRNTATIPGFRKGTAPMGLIQGLYKESVVADSVQKAVNKALYDYIDNEKIDLLGYPLANDEKTPTCNFKTDKDFVFYFDAALRPKVELHWDKVQAALNQITVSDEDVDKQVTDICKREGHFDTPEAVDAKSTVYGKVVALDADGNPQEGGLDRFISFDLTDVDDEISNLFVGKKKDDVVEMPLAQLLSIEQVRRGLNYDDVKVKEATGNVRFTLSGCSTMTPHEINQELFDKVFPGKGITTEEAFRQAVKEQMVQSYESVAHEYYVKDVLDQLFAAFDTTLPEDFLRRLYKVSADKDTTPESIDAEWNDRYLPSIKRELISSALNDMENIEPSREDIVNEIKSMLRKGDAAAATPEEEAALQSQAEKYADYKEMASQVANTIYSRKCYDLFAEQLKPEVKEVSVEEFRAQHA